MENKNHPTIEEVIAYFKDAEEVECLNRKKFFKLSFKPPFIDSQNLCGNPYNTQFLWMNTNDKINCAVYDFDTKQFAKITKYKPEINLSKITPDLIRELNKDPNIHDILVKEGVVVEKAKPTEPAYIQVPISEIDSLSSKKLGRFVKELASKY